MNRKAVINAVKVIIINKAKPSRIWLYGSEASGDSLENSDIDIAYLDTSDDALTRSCILSEIKDEAEKINTLIKIDISNIAATEERFSMRVKTTGKVLFSSSKPLRAEDAIYNYSRALTKLQEAQDALPSLVESGLQDIYLDLIVKRFEFTYEMSWKAIKRVLNMLGIEGVKSPRACFKEAYAQELITDQTIWLDMIEMRNLSSHTYDELEIQQLKDKLPTYSIAFQDLIIKLKVQLEES
jgi:nucleotidyltransferase substrate binding protein (TIGR01987 family)